MRGILDVEVQSHLTDGRDGLKRGHGLFMDETRDVRVVGGDRDIDSDVGFLVDADGFYEAKGDDVAAEAGVANGGECGTDVRFGRHEIGKGVTRREAFRRMNSRGDGV